MAQSTVLGLSASNYAATQREYSARVEDDRIENFNRDRQDAFAGHVTASFCEVFHVSGTVSDHLGVGTDLAAGEFYAGLRYNSMSPRHITRVEAFTRMSGSGGVTVVDVRKSAGAVIPTSNYSLFSNNVYKCILSASEGSCTVSTAASVFAAGSSSWAAGELLGVVLDSAADVATDLTVLVHWIPSASYG